MPDEREPLAVLRGRIVTVDGDPAGGVTVTAEWGSVQGSASSAADGGFEVGLPEVPQGLGTLVFTPPTSAYLPSWVPLMGGALDDSVRLVLLPARWTVRDGIHGGSTIDVHPADAADASTVAPSYWGFGFPFVQVGHVQTVTDSTRWGGAYSTWRPERLPIRVAVDRTSEPFAAADSVELWAGLREVEEALGRSLFVPARMEELGAPDPDLQGMYAGALVVAFDSALSGVGLRGRTVRASYGATWLRSEDVSEWSGGRVTRLGVLSRDIEAGRLSIRDAAALRDRALVIHEAMHVLGAEHGCVWQSIQTYADVCPLQPSTVPTVHDVAYLELLEHTRMRENTLGTTLGILPAVWGERVVVRGSTPIPEP